MPSLFVIEHGLSDLFDARQELEEQVCFTPEEQADKRAAQDAVDLAIVEYVTAEIRKVDNIARFLIELKARRAAVLAEIQRLEGITRACENTFSRISEIVLQIMRDTDTKKLEGKLSSLRRQANGGVLAVEVVQPDLVPEEFQRVTVQMPLSMWEGLAELVSTEGLTKVKRTSQKPDLTAIRKELEKRVPCPACKGKGRVVDPDPEANHEIAIICETCGGEGTVSNGVPGCRLAERGEHLRVS
jgi:hypothetical protein